MSSINNKNFKHYIPETEKRKILELLQHAEQRFSPEQTLILDLGSVPIHQTVQAYPVAEAAA